MLVFDVSVFSRDLIEDFVKQTVGQLHDVVFREARDLLAIVSSRILKRVTNDLFGPRPRNQFQTLNDLIRLAMLDTRIKIFLVLAYHDYVHHRMFRLDERVIRNARPYIGVQTKHLSNSYVETLVAAALRRGDGCF